MDEKSAQDAAVSAQKLFSEMAAQNGYELASKRGEPGRPVAVYRETVGVPDRP